MMDKKCFGEHIHPKHFNPKQKNILFWAVIFLGEFFSQNVLAAVYILYSVQPQML